MCPPDLSIDCCVCDLPHSLRISPSTHSLMTDPGQQVAREEEARVEEAREEEARGEEEEELRPDRLAEEVVVVVVVVVVGVGVGEEVAVVHRGPLE